MYRQTEFAIQAESVFLLQKADDSQNTENRPEYNRMKEEIQNGTIQAKTIVVRALDRLHRNAAHQLEDLPSLKNRTFV